jgi:hypothetical protein
MIAAISTLVPAALLRASLTATAAALTTATAARRWKSTSGPRTLLAVRPRSFPGPYLRSPSAIENNDHSATLRATIRRGQP